MDRKNKKKYQQLKEKIKSELLSGHFERGDFFHTEQELMKRYKASYATVSHAMKDLARMGVFERVRGYGTTVKSIPAASPGNLTGETLYISGIKTALQPRKADPTSWFVFESIQRGIINSWPGLVQIKDPEEIEEIAKTKTRMNAIFLSPLSDFLEKLGGFPQITYIAVDLRRDLGMDFNRVTVEVVMGVYLLVSYLIKELNHQKIALLGGDRSEYHADRYAGYRLALDAHFIPFQAKYCVRGLPSSKEGAYEATRTLMQLPAPPTAVFADTDLKALGAMEAIQDLKLKVPEEVSVVGFDDAPGTENFTPPLTTLRIPYGKIGEEAAKMLIERIASDGADLPTRILQGEIVKRSSCAALKKKKEQ